MGATNNKGYGVLMRRPRHWLAHRYIYTQHKGPIPDGMHLCHTCDNPLCVNPDHMFIGTAKDNMQDRERKGRGADRHGSKNGKTKLTVETVHAIRAAEGTTRDLAKQFGISPAQLNKIRNRKVWTHV